MESSCVDSGVGTAYELGLSRHTTRTDGAGDTGAVDIGYHYAGMAVFNMSLTETGVKINWNAKPGAMYAVMMSLDTATWDEINVGQTNTWTDTDLTGCTRKFYMVKEY